MKSPWYEIIYIMEILTSIRFGSVMGILGVLTISFIMLTYALLTRLENATQSVNTRDDLLRWIKGHQAILE